MTTASDTQAMTREVTLTRMIAAPRGLVWAAWTEPKHMGQWGGPHHLTNPACGMDVRRGGKFMIHMKAPDGTVYPMPGTFTEVIKPQRLRFTAFAEGLDGTRYLESDTVVTFEEQGGRTKLTVKASAKGFHPAAPQMLAGMDAGWSQSLEKLEALTAAMAK